MKYHPNKKQIEIYHFATISSEHLKVSRFGGYLNWHYLTIPSITEAYFYDWHHSHTEHVLMMYLLLPVDDFPPGHEDVGRGT